MDGHTNSHLARHRQLNECGNSEVSHNQCSYCQKTQNKKTTKKTKPMLEDLTQRKHKHIIMQGHTLL